MAHAAPASGKASRSGRMSGAERRASERHGRTPDVFDARTHRMARIAVPVVLGLIYGYWAAANQRFGGPVTGWNLLFGFVTALVFAVLCAALLAMAPRMPREVHAVLWAAFTGAAFGFLYSQSNGPVWETVLISLFVSAGTFITLFYRYYTREDAAGHRVH
ncbi:hypothetical protein GCM10010503_34010 [Streptomyces lucensis JCM 4490]|uniref:Uncharacterized protein n=1 Tax=Streptomyces lucensis JCM 4490 TaxID=1306176 RepID=A0A918JAL2_9ACTN|nr:hypothetical protein [Streptomyces lucensis]GGW53972.1 hypothetical protein GCM10010503_34010 [Streptomyces lucensis JCM 4490]